MEKPCRSERSQRRRKTPSFSSSLLEAIYHSIDESVEEKETSSFAAAAAAYRRNNNNNNGGVEVEEEITSLRRAIMLEKWMESYTRRHFNSDSSSSTDSSLFSSSETESSAASRSTPKSSIFTAKTGREIPAAAATLCAGEGNQKREGRFMRTKSRALKIYGDLKKVKQPISPGGKIANFLNSIFNSSRSNSLKKHPAEAIEDWSSVRNLKSRSVKDSTMASRSCLNKTPSRAKSKRSVRFCPVSVILDEDCQPCGHKNTYENEKNPMPYITTHYINNSFRDSREIYDENSSSSDDEDVRSCTSSDLFELENVGSFSRVVDATAAADELPVYGTTSLKLNQAIANGLRS